VRPAADAWYSPDNALTAEPESEPEPDLSQLPGATPERTGAWYTPPDASLDTLLAGAADAIDEIHAPEPPHPAQMSEDTQAQSLAATQAQPAAWATPSQEPVMTDPAQTPPSPGDEPSETRILSASEGDSAAPASPAMPEPALTADSTPSPDATPPQPISPGLSPAEAALLAEQRAVEPPQAAAPMPPQATTQPPRRPEAAASTPPPSEPTPFEQVERKVQGLRQQYQAGYMTHDQLQNELRRLMILGEDGRWWMLGLESNRWYSYDGKTWAEGIPPGYQAPVRGSGVPTESGLQQVVGLKDSMEEEGALTPIQIDEDGMPLPRRVPQVDPGATLVSPNAPFIEPVRPSEAPTQSKSRQVDSAAAGYVPAPARDMGQPSRPIPTAPRAAEPAPIEPTLRSAVSFAGEPTAPHGVSTVPQDRGAQPPTPARPRYKVGEYPQPDYSVAYGNDRRATTRRIIYTVIFSIVGVMALTLVALLVMIGYYLYQVDQYTEAVNNLRERTSDFETTIIMDANGNKLAEFSDPTTGPRQEVPLYEISPWLIHATISTENETFYDDPGFSILAIIRAVYQNVQAGNTVSGASTITQQLARALVLETEFASERTTERKIVEIIVASEITRKYTKNEMLEIYLNEIFYGNRAYGIEAAARTYFSKSAKDLNPAEAAFLAGLPQSPATYDPVVNREAALQRMKTVLRLMSEANGTGCIYIEHDDTSPWAVPSGGGLCITTQTQPDGNIVYYYQTPNMAAPQEMTLDIARVEIATFKPPATPFVHPHFVNYVWQQLEDKYGPQRIYSAGFRVQTTLDERIQTAAEGAVTTNLAALQASGVDATNASVVVIRPSDGAVLAMVGSANYYNENIDGQVNVAFTGQQPGSSIKPFVYLAAFEPDSQGRYLTPASVLWDVRTEYPNPGGGPAYVPENFDNRYRGPESVRRALGNSLNVPAVKVINFVTVERFTEVAERIGLQFPLGDPVERSAGLPTALGAVEVRLFDMVAGFGMLANNGRRVDPYAILYIEDADGNEVYKADASPAGLQVIQPEYAYLITNILSDADARADKFGYGPPLQLTGGRPAAVKTGTSGSGGSDVRDIWTVGYTPQMVVGVWVGNSDNRPMYGAFGYTGAAPIWNQVMEAAHAGLNVAQFPQPSGLNQAEICVDSGVLASQACAGRTRVELFASSAPPPGPDKHLVRSLQVDSFSGRLVNEFCQDNMVTRSFVAIDDPSAYTWLNNTAEGNAWLRERGIEPPVQPPPTEYCDPNEQRPVVVLSYPPDNMMVEGILPLRGTVSMQNFNRYEIRYGNGAAPTSFSEPLFFDTTMRPEAEALLGQFDTRGLPNGVYTLRLIAYDNLGRSVIRDVRITVNNAQPPTLIPSFATPTLAPSLTPAFFATPAPGLIVPTVGPTLTPTWTLTPTPQGQ
jgi:membrane peptidoglycan carboxypeptidase